jgi:hypothetical protein
MSYDYDYEGDDVWDIPYDYNTSVIQYKSEEEEPQVKIEREKAIEFNRNFDKIVVKPIRDVSKFSTYEVYFPKLATFFPYKVLYATPRESYLPANCKYDRETRKGFTKRKLDIQKKYKDERNKIRRLQKEQGKSDEEKLNTRNELLELELVMEHCEAVKTLVEIQENHPHKKEVAKIDKEILRDFCIRGIALIRTWFLKFQIITEILDVVDFKMMYMSPLQQSGNKFACKVINSLCPGFWHWD